MKLKWFFCVFCVLLVVPFVLGDDPTCRTQYVFQGGDVAWNVWKDYVKEELKTSWLDFQAMNAHIQDLDNLDAGDVLCVSENYVPIIYKVRGGDNMFNIWQERAKRFGLVRWSDFLLHNAQIETPAVIKPGDLVVISKHPSREQRKTDKEVISTLDDTVACDSGDYGSVSECPLVHYVFDYGGAIGDVVDLNEELTKIHEETRYTFVVVTYGPSVSYGSLNLGAVWHAQKLDSLDENGFLIAYFSEDHVFGVIGPESRKDFTQGLYYRILSEYLSSGSLSESILGSIGGMGIKKERDVIDVVKDLLGISGKRNRVQALTILMNILKHSQIEGRQCYCDNDCGKYAKLIIEYSDKNNIDDPLLVLSWIMQESSCDAKASSGSYCGLMQIPCTTPNWQDPEANIAAGINIFKQKENYFQTGACSSDSDCKPKFVKYCGNKSCTAKCSNVCEYEFYGCGSDGYKFYSGDRAALRAYVGWGCDSTLTRQDFYVEEILERHKAIRSLT